MAKVCLFILGLMFVSAVFSKHDEWYCKVREDKYEICRKCKTLDEDCDEEAPADCKCENLKFANVTGDYEMVGGPETCQTDDPFCYVTENSSCDDAEYSSVNDRLENIWLNPEVYYSYKACDSGNQDDNTGNEKTLRNVKIIGNSYDQVYPDTIEECREACKSRIGECGSWSFDSSEEICYLHTVDSCCGQFGKRERNSSFTSGYTCQYCWSTKANTDCPCSLKERSEKPRTRHASGGDNQCTGQMLLSQNFIIKNQRNHNPFRNILKETKRFSSGEPQKIWKNWKFKGRRLRGREKLKSEKATLVGGTCCWTICGSRREKIVLTPRNLVPQLNFYVREVKSHKCDSKSINFVQC